MFVFLNRRKNQVKLIVWTRRGFTIVHKRLQRGTFTFPARVVGDATSVAIDVHELAMLLEGIDVSHAKSKPRWDGEGEPETDEADAGPDEVGPQDMLGLRDGPTVADTSGLFDASFLRPELIECGCNMHSRRYFVKALDAGDKRAALPLAA